MGRLQSLIRHALRQSESFFGTDMVYIASGGSWLVFSQIISSISGLLLSVVFANFLSKDAYGVYQFTLSIAGLLAIATLSGMNTALTNSVARGDKDSLKQVFRAKVQWGMWGGIAGALLAVYYWLNGNLFLSLMVLAAAAFVPFYDSLLIFNSWWNGKKDFKSLAWSSVSTRLVSVAVTALTVIATNNVILILLTYFTVNTLMRWVFFCRVKTESISGGAAETVKASTLSYGKHLSFMGILSTIAVYIDKVLVFHYLGAANLAVYTFATIIPDQVRNVLRNISTLALPKFAARSVADIKKTLGPRMAKMAILIGAIVTAYIVSAPYIFRILFPNYLESVIYSQAAAIGLLAYVAVVPLTVMQAKQATKGLYWHTTITSVIKILLLLAIVPVYGIWGAVISLIIYQFVALIPPIIYLKNQP